MVHVQNLKERRIHQQEYCDTGKRRADHGTGKVLRGVLVFLDKIDRRVPPVVGNDNRPATQTSIRERHCAGGRMSCWERSSFRLNGNCECGDDDGLRRRHLGLSPTPSHGGHPMDKNTEPRNFAAGKGINSPSRQATAQFAKLTKILAVCRQTLPWDYLRVARNGETTQPKRLSLPLCYGRYFTLL
jgi:hypothetical protein